MLKYLRLSHTHSPTHTHIHVLLRTFPDDYGQRRGRGCREYLANVFSQLTRMLIFFCQDSGSYFYFELCTKCLFTPEKSCLGMGLGLGPARPSSSTHLAPGCRILFLFCRHRRLLLLAAVYFTALTITSCPGSVVRGAWCLVLVLLGPQQSWERKPQPHPILVPSRPLSVGHFVFGLMRPTNELNTSHKRNPGQDPGQDT